MLSMSCACDCVQQTSAARVARTDDRARRKVRGAGERVKPWSMRRGRNYRINRFQSRFPPAESLADLSSDGAPPQRVEPFWTMGPATPSRK